MLSLRKYFIYSLGLLCLTSVSSCSLLEQSQRFFEQQKNLVLRGSSGKVSEVEDSLNIAARKLSAHSGPVLSPPKKQISKPDSVSVASGKAVKSKRQKQKDMQGSSAVTKKELEAAKKDAQKNVTQDTEAVGSTVLPGDTIPVLTVANQLPEDASLAGEWTIYSVRTNHIEGEERPYINFDLKAHRFYGTNGCNYINGDLQIEPNGKLSMTNIIATQMLCDDSTFEHIINLALSDVAGYSLRQDGSATYLDLIPADSATPLIVLKRLNMDFLNGAWKITAINGIKMEEEASITIDVDERRIHGNTGCNVFNGDLFIDPDKYDSMQFCNLISTRMACPTNVRETELLLALEEAESARALNQNTAEIFSDSGELLLTLEKINLSLRDESYDTNDN